MGVQLLLTDRCFLVGCVLGMGGSDSELVSVEDYQIQKANVSPAVSTILKGLVQRINTPSLVAVAVTLILSHHSRRWQLTGCTGARRLVVTPYVRTYVPYEGLGAVL